MDSKNESKEIYADEVISAMIGFPISKIIFSSVKKVEDGKIEKVEAVTIAINTLSLLKGCNFILNSAKNASENIIPKADKFIEEFKQIVE